MKKLAITLMCVKKYSANIRRGSVFKITNVWADFEISGPRAPVTYLAEYRPPPGIGVGHTGRWNIKQVGSLWIWFFLSDDYIIIVVIIIINEKKIRCWQHSSPMTLYNTKILTKYLTQFKTETIIHMMMRYFLIRKNTRGGKGMEKGKGT